MGIRQWAIGKDREATFSSIAYSLEPLACERLKGVKR